MSITPANIVRSALLCEAVYSLPESTIWHEVPSLGENHLLTRSIPLHRNLVGEKGSLEIAIFSRGDTLYICFSGSEDAEYWLYNFSTFFAHYKGWRFHRGLFTLASEVYKATSGYLDDIFNSSTYNKIVHCGHSAGGAVAGIFPLLLGSPIPSYIVDFGTPRYIASPLSDDDRPYPYQRIRFQHIYDLIPCVPLTWRGPLPGYSHFGNPRYITPARHIIDKLPWWRPLPLAWKYLHSLVRKGPLDQLWANHSIHHYTATVLQNYPVDPLP